MPDWAVVIPAFNGASFLPRAFEALSLQSLPPSTVVVVDNGSSDDTVAIAEKSAVATEIIRQPENLGFGRACNSGIQRVLDRGVDYVLLLNQDAVLAPDAGEELMQLMAAYPDYGAMSALQLDYAGTAIDEEFRCFLPPAFVDDLYFGRRASLYEVDFAPAAAFMVRVQVFLEIGGFDPLFFMYGEDNDFCHRTGAVGWKIGLAANAVLRHWNGHLQREKSFAWWCNWHYSRALLHAKSSPRAVWAALCSLLRYHRPCANTKDVAAWLCGLGRCFLRSRVIASHRKFPPHKFSAPIETSSTGMRASI